MNDDLNGPIRTNQVLVGALMMGMVIFGAFASVIVLISEPAEAERDAMGMIMLGIAAAMWLGSVVATFVIGAAMLERARTSWNEKPGEQAADLLPQYSTVLMLKAALLEGPGLFGAVVFLLTGQWVALAIPALSLVGLGLMFPTKDRFLNFASRVMGRPVH